MTRWFLMIATLTIASVTTVALGDQVVMSAAQAKDATFRGVDAGRILLVTGKGKFRKEQPSRVTRILLSKPLKVSYLTADSKQEEEALLKGYEKQKFQLVKDGKDLEIPAQKMKTMDILGDAGGGGAGNRYPVPEIDLSALQGPNTTPAQKKALARFEVAKQAYDDFVAESSTLVAKMDKATGAKRESFLNDLRMRKNQEQPLKSELVDACSALTEAFPEAAPEAAAPPAPVKRSK